MLIATDPLSLVFIACFLAGLIFILLSALLGSPHHGLGHLAHGMHPATGHAVAHGASTLSHGHASARLAQIHGNQGSLSDKGSNSFASLLANISPLSIALFLLGFG